jgi:2-alkyl-3-oxoalkanoate reductase
MITKVFVTGATGVLGKRVVRLLLENDIGVVGLCRSRENEEVLEKLGALSFRGSIFNTGHLTLASADCDAILHLATSMPKRNLPNKPSDWTMNDRLRTEGTRNLLKASVINGIEKFIQQSVTLLYGERGGEYVNPDMTAGDNLPFMVDSALEMERMIRLEDGVDHLILRFGSFYSEDSLSTLRMVEGIRRRRFPIIGDGSYYRNNIHVDDAADAVVYSLIEFDRLRNTTLNFTDFHPIPFRDMVLEVAKMTHSGKPLQIPSCLAKKILGKSIYTVVTGSHRIDRDELIEDWEPRNKNFVEGMRGILHKVHRVR